MHTLVYIYTQILYSILDINLLYHGLYCGTIKNVVFIFFFFKLLGLVLLSDLIFLGFACS